MSKGSADAAGIARGGDQRHRGWGLKAAKRNLREQRANWQRVGLVTEIQEGGRTAANRMSNYRADSGTMAEYGGKGSVSKAWTFALARRHR